jgi:hypothetical protein
VPQVAPQVVAPPFLLTVHLFNIDAPTNFDTYIIVDNIAGSSVMTPPILGGTTFDFQVQAGNDGFGNITITNPQSGVPNHIAFVTDGATFRL